MKLACVHCGNDFSITAEQLGGKGRCPHCHAQVSLPKAGSPDLQDDDNTKPSSWLENSISGLGSFVFHLVLTLILALIIRGGGGESSGETYEIFIGELATENLTDEHKDELENEEVENVSEETFEEPLENLQPPGVTADDTSDTLTDIEMSVSGGANDSISFDAAAMPTSSSGGEDFQGLVKRLKRDGLDIVISFDSTGSMSGEISEVKNKIQRIGKVLKKMIPKTRISICTYRDTEDTYVVKGLPLTSNMSQVHAYLDQIYASGGGDYEEAVHKGLRWPIANNQFRSRARKVILLFGDAPPHRQHRDECIKIASDFRKQRGGIVSTVTCHSDERLREFSEIAQAGGGEAFLTEDERGIMTQLIVLVFGSKHRSKVLKAFEILDE